MTDDPRDPTPSPGTPPGPQDRDAHGPRGRGDDPATGDTGTAGSAGDRPSARPDASSPEAVDELASAVLDGEIAGDDAEAALRRPEVADRVAQLAAVRDAVRATPPPADARRRDAAIAAALDAFDAESGAAAPAGPPVGRPTPPQSGDDLAAARAARVARSERIERAGRWLAAAAAVVLVVVVGVAVLRSGGTSDDAETADVAADAPETSDAADDASEGGEADEEAGGGAGDSTRDAPSSAAESADEGAGREFDDDALPDLGAFRSADDLLAAAAASSLDELPDDGAADAELRENAARVVAACTADPPDVLARAGDAARPVAVGMVDGMLLAVWSGGTGNDPLLVAVDPDCSVLATRPAP